MPRAITAPPSRDAPTESHHLVRERHFPSADLTAILSTIRAERATGQLIIDISQGSIGSVRLREQHKVFPGDK